MRSLRLTVGRPRTFLLALAGWTVTGAAGGEGANRQDSDYDVLGRGP